MLRNKRQFILGIKYLALCAAAWADVAECVQKPCLRHAFCHGIIFSWTWKLCVRKSTYQHRIAANYQYLGIYETDVIYMLEIIAKVFKITYYIYKITIHFLIYLFIGEKGKVF